MSQNYYHHRDCIVAVLEDLREKLGDSLEVFGFKEDKSDFQTDYYSPAHWDGVAVHKPSGAVVIVGRPSQKPGGEITEQRAAVVKCYRCKATGKAIKPEPAYTVRALIGGTVERTPALNIGDTCPTCKGKGEHDGYEPVVVGHWPDFKPNARPDWWSVQKGGRELARGRLLYAAVRGGSHPEEKQKRDEARRANVAGILAALEGNAGAVRAGQARAADAAPPAVDFGGAAVRVTPGRRAGVAEVRHAAKPDEEARAALKRHGFRWAIRSRCWYGPASALAALGLPAPEGEPIAEPQPAHAE